jgi:outer membrane protein TolC
MNRNVDATARGANLRITIMLTGLALFAGAARSQTEATQPSTLTLERSIEYALAHYPAVRVALERQAAASAEIGVAKTNYLPRADALWQGNRTTHNNFFGLLLPQNVVPSISGPVLPASTNDNAWDSAAGVLVSWQPFDFGYREALVNVARAQHGCCRHGGVSEADTTLALPAQVAPYEIVDVYPKVTAFIESIRVDRGSRVHAGELIIHLSAPELIAQRTQSEAGLHSAQAQLAGVQAKLASDSGTLLHLTAAAKTPGVVAGNDLLVVEQTVAADNAQVEAASNNVQAARDSVRGVTQLEYLLGNSRPI